MKHLLLLALAALTFASCASTPPVWRSSTVAPSSPIPTLMAASGYEFYIKPTTIDASGLSLKSLGKAIEADPGLAFEGAAAIANSVELNRTCHQAVANAAPAMHERVVGFLQSQGFEIEYDENRIGAVPARSDDFDWSAPMTADAPFGGGRMNDDQIDIKNDSKFPVWGANSKKGMAERLRSGRDREAYASIEATFHAAGNNPANGVNCNLIVQVLGQDATLLFESRTVGSAAGGGSIEAQITQAFDAAYQQMTQPVTIAPE